MDCLFCNIPEERVIAQNELAYAVRDGFPVTPLHTLVIPKSHAVDYFALTPSELLGCDQLIKKLSAEIRVEDPNVDGFNIGLNAGQSAGQTIFHCHFHLIPRRAGDIADPKGGIRHVIPGKGYYSEAKED